MNKIIPIAVTLVMLFTLITTLQALRDLNDGRVATVVKQLTMPHVQTAEAKSLKRVNN